MAATLARATRKDDAILVPVAILVNSQTSGAAEALAAVMREGAVGLIVGATTAGQASVFKEFPLSNGQKLRVAVARVSLAGGAALTQGIVPDIPVEANLADEEWTENPTPTSIRRSRKSRVCQSTAPAASSLERSRAGPRTHRRRNTGAPAVRLRAAGRTRPSRRNRPVSVAPWTY